MERFDFSFHRVLILGGGKSHALSILRSVLSSAGIGAVLQAADTEAAMEVLSRENLNAVFFDSAIGGYGGVSFPIAVRRKGMVVNPMVPLYCVYDRARRRDVESSRDSGVTDVITTPISPKAILAKLKAPPRPFIVAQEFFGPDRRSKRRPPYFGEDRRKRTAKKAKIDFAHI